MDIIQENLSVNMIREHLNDIPEHTLPAGYSFVWYMPGYEKLWIDIHLQSEKYATISYDLYYREFGRGAAILSQRQVFLFDARDRAIGTTTGWYNSNYNGKSFGRIHWVAMLPEMQGKGLSKPMMSLVCQRMRELEHNRAYLVTSTARIPAINLYLKFGFVPEIRSAEDERAWRGVQEVIGKDILTDAVITPLSE